MTKVDDYLTSLPDWQRRNLEMFRKLVHEADDSITEDWKWSVPVFVVKGKMIFAMSAFKAHTKFNFIGNGAKLADPHHLFNGGLESKQSRGIDLREGDPVDTEKLTHLIKSSLDLVSPLTK
jgi:hypothetical protein